MATATEITRRESVGSGLLWFGLLGAPFAWLIELSVGYSLEEWFACSPSSTTQGLVLGIGVQSLALVVPLATLGIALAAGITATVCLRRIPEPHDHIDQRARWMAWAGVMNSALYGLTIITSLAIPVLLDTCATTP